jgi:ankyrin repeat protein
LKNGANLGARDVNGATPLYVACKVGNLGIVKHLLERGADVNAVNLKGWTPLNIASCKGHYDIVELLIRYGAKLDSSNVYGETPLLNATKMSNFDVIRLLVEAGANMLISDNNGRLPLYIAKMNEDDKIIKFLINATPMATLRMPTADKASLEDVFKTRDTKKTFTSTRPVRVKDAELSDDSSDDEKVFSDGHMSGITQFERPKVHKGRSSVKNSRSWIQFRELA